MMSRSVFFVVGLAAWSFLILAPAQSVAAGPVPGKAGVASPLGGSSVKPAPTGMPLLLPAQRGAPATAPAGKAPAPPAPGAPSSLAAEPKWPQPFEMGGGERTGYGFVVGRPGPIVVSVKWKGSPLTVSLVKPGGGSVERSGNGAVTVEYTATADDVKKGMLWMVGLRSAQEAAGSSGSGIQVLDKPVKRQPQAVAQGTVSVSHPPGDTKAAQAELKGFADKAAAQLKPLLSATGQGTSRETVAAKKQAEFAQAQSARQMQMLNQLRPKLPAEAYRKMSQAIAFSSTSPAAAPSGVSAPMKPPSSMIDRTGVRAVPAGGFSQTQSADIGTVGSNPPQSVASPEIASLSVSSGQPGDPVLVTGSGFSSSPGEVHFIVGNGRDIAAPVSAWNDTQIFTSVPDVSGIMGFNGQLYIRRGTFDSKFVPFRFNPATEFRTLGMTSDRDIRDYLESSMNWYSEVQHDRAGSFFGASGYDRYYLITRLKNGWVVDSAYLLSKYSGSGIFIYNSANAYITGFRPGTDSPYLNVRWWVDALSSVMYGPRVVIRGPRGVPHE